MSIEADDLSNLFSRNENFMSFRLVEKSSGDHYLLYGEKREYGYDIELCIDVTKLKQDREKERLKLEEYNYNLKAPVRAIVTLAN